MSDIPLAAMTKESAVQAKTNIIAAVKEFNVTAEDINELCKYLNANKNLVHSAIHDVKSGKSGASIAMGLLPKLFKK